MLAANDSGLNVVIWLQGGEIESKFFCESFFSFFSTNDALHAQAKQGSPRRDTGIYCTTIEGIAYARDNGPKDAKNGGRRNCCATEEQAPTHNMLRVSENWSRDNGVSAR
jgi:hypothetical protein